MDRPMRLVLFCILAGVAVSTCSPAIALVRFGQGVFIGGHDFSNQTYGPHRRAIIHLYAHRPTNEGCSWHLDRRGDRVRVCRLRRIR